MAMAELACAVSRINRPLSNVTIILKIPFSAIRNLFDSVHDPADNTLMNKSLTMGDTGIEDPVFKYWSQLTDLSDAVLDDPELEAADLQAAQRFFETGEPTDPAVKMRIYARIARSREEMFRKNGYVDCSQFWVRSTYDE